MVGSIIYQCFGMSQYMKCQMASLKCTKHLIDLKSELWRYESKLYELCGCFVSIVW